MGSSIVLNSLVFVICIYSALNGVAEAGMCYDEDGEDFSCPTHNDKPNQTFCCGEVDKQRCCDEEEYKLHGTNVSKAVVMVIGFVFLLVIILLIILCCCCCCQCCLLYKVRQRRQATTTVTMTPMQPRAPVPSTDAAGRPLYPIQQHYPDASGYPQQGYYPPPQYPAEGAPLTGNTDGGVYPTKQLANVTDHGSKEPFTYGPAT